MRHRHALCGLAFLLTFACTFTLTAQDPARRGPENGPANRTASVDPPPLETDLTLLTVSVTSKGNAVPGLGQNRFQVFEDGVEQKISYFWTDSRPISVGFIVDASSGMANLQGDTIRSAGPAFLKLKNTADEYFVIEFNDYPAMVVSYTTDPKLMPTVFPASGETPLYDAIFNGLDAIKEAANPRKALIVITAGGNNNKGVTEDQLVNYAIKQPVQIYSMMVGASFGEQASIDATVLDLLAGVSGGRTSLVPDSSFAVDAMYTELAQALKTQYLIGYKSTNTAKDGHRRGVKVKVRSSEGSPKLTVWTKSGYYSTKEPKTDKTK